MSGIEKQDLALGNPEPREAVTPRLHPAQDILNATRGGNLRANAIIESIAYYAIEQDWESVWNIADGLKREISVLFDNQGWVWVDVGTPGMVQLSPPLGSQLPLRLWVHTHPWDAYWSATDKRTLGTVSGILDRALVLGHNHLMRTVYRNEVPVHERDQRLDTDGVLMHWTLEAVVAYSSFKN